jgi:hypothetical protein
MVDYIEWTLSIAAGVYVVIALIHASQTTIDLLEDFEPGEPLNLSEGRYNLAPVSTSPDFLRIKALPTVETIGGSLEHLMKPGATMQLWRHQWMALIQARKANGLFAPITVGGGKTLIACLLPTVLNKRAVILTTASLVEQGNRMLETYRQHFHIRDDLQFVSYGILSGTKHSGLLEKLKPELIIADECQNLSKADAARTKRFRRYMSAHPGTTFCAMSGSVTKRSLMDFAHLCALALGRGSPLPLEYPAQKEWAEAVDVSDNPRPAGVLLELTPGATDARSAVQGRMRRTLGFVTSSELEELPTLCIRLIDHPRVCKREIRDLHKTWTRPDGEELTLAIEVARVERQLRLGGYYRWCWEKWDGPRYEWMAARSAYNRDMRQFLKHHNRPGMDSPALVEEALDRGNISWTTYEAWKKFRGIPPPPKEWKWLDMGLVDWAQEYAAVHGPMIVWTDVTAVGQHFARYLRFRYYGAGKEIDESGTSSIAASIRAHGTGKHLVQFNRCLVLGSPGSGAAAEQLLGRCHRPGQTKEVIYEGLKAFEEEWDAAREDAEYIRGSLGTAQKLLTSVWR